MAFKRQSSALSNAGRNAPMHRSSGPRLPTSLDTSAQTTFVQASLVAEPGSTVQSHLQDRFGRHLTDLRVSVTDRCNYRCVYCRIGEDKDTRELPIASYARIVQLFLSLGITKLRLTGGEPLLRPDLEDLIAAARDGNQGTELPVEIALTTNGHLLAGRASRLRAAGLDRLTLSLDGLDDAVVTEITRVPRAFGRILDGLHAAQDAGFTGIKINCVLVRGVNDHQIEDFVEFARRERVIVRFIEFMPLEEGGSWSRDRVVAEDEILDRLSRLGPLDRLSAKYAGETANRYAYRDGSAELGLIAPVSRPFCGHCARIRVTSDGKIRTCLFSHVDHNLYSRMQQGASDEALRGYLRQVVWAKELSHHIGEPGFVKPSRSMVQIGG